MPPVLNFSSSLWRRRASRRRSRRSDILEHERETLKPNDKLARKRGCAESRNPSLIWEFWILEFRGHNTYLVLRRGFGLCFCLRSLRFNVLSSRSVKLSPSRGLPVRSRLRRRLTSRYGIWSLIDLPQSSTSSSKGVTLTSRLSRPQDLVIIL